MKNVALLVTATLKTRVVVSVPDEFDEKSDDNLLFNSSVVDDDLLDAIAYAAGENYKDAIGYGVLENIDEIVNDTDVPYREGYNERN